jgi:uncharacterized protein (DUF488 family)
MVETIFTIGHSTRSIDEFIRILHSHGVRRIVDVRTIAKSRHNPQFGEDALGPSLAEQGIGYERFEVLGGLRHTNSHSVNGAWRNASFRGYADYMQTPEFAAGIDELIALGAREAVAIMCAEAVPWRCHRSLIADALLVRGIDVLDIMSEKGAKPHAMTRFAQVDGLTITYPPEPGQEAGETANASPEAGNAESGNAGNGDTESGNAGNGNTEAGNAESGNTEAANAENGNAETAH